MRQFARAFAAIDETMRTNEKVDAMVGHRPDHFAAVVRRRDVAGVGAQIFRDQRPRLAVVLNDRSVRDFIRCGRNRSAVMALICFINPKGGVR